MTPIRILLIEDDMLSRITLQEKLKIRGEVVTAISKEEAKIKLSRQHFDIAFIDLDLDKELDGLLLIPKIKEKNVHAVVLSAREEDQIIQKAYEVGCDDYLVKPFTHNSIELIFKKFNQRNLKGTLENLLLSHFHTIGKSLKNQIETIGQALLSDQPILINGETGTGKTHLAKLIHELSGDHLPFVEINCSEFSESLLESELFGHEKGAFTGALRNKKGLLELANGGILFLDEVATMSSGLQKKLLKAIEEKEFYSVGSERKIKSNFRLISATCENLAEKITNGDFRQDMYFRIKGFQINLLPLRERQSDIEPLLKHFIKTADRKIVFTEEALNLLTNYNWPGNIRELQKLVTILSLNNKGIIEAKDLNSMLIFEATVDQAHKINLEEIKKWGLNSFIEKMEMEIFEIVSKENNEKVRKTLSDLKISNNAYYRILNNVKNKKGQDHVS
jgi:DNA-binding NtrC family response regulator